MDDATSTPTVRGASSLHPAIALWGRRVITRAFLVEATAFALLIAGAVALRIFRLGSIPEIITGDETDNLQTAYHILEGTGPGVFGFDWKPAPILSLYPLAWSVRVFGDSVSDFRMFAVIQSMIAIVLFYVLARRAMGVFGSVSGGALLATNWWYLHFSRTAWENTNAAIFALGAIWCAVEAAESGRRWSQWWLFTGVFTAGGLYGYFTGRFVFVSVVLVCVAAVTLRRAPLRSTAIGLCLAGAVALVIFLPLAESILGDWDRYTQRTQNVSVFNTQGEYYGETDGWIIAAKNATWSYREFVLQDGSQARGYWYRYNPRNIAPLDLITMHLFWAGMIVAVFRWRETYAWWTAFAPLVIAESFSRGTPDLARAIVIAPFYFLFAGLALDQLWRWRPSRTALRPLALGASGIAVAAAMFVNVNRYFDWQDKEVTQGFRLPGVHGCEFDVWQDLARQAARDSATRGYTLVNAQEFDRRRRELDCSEIIRNRVLNAQ